MLQINSSLARPIKLAVLMLGIGGVLAGCNLHDRERRGPVHYSQRHWHDGDRHRDRSNRFGWRQDRHDDHRHNDDRYYDRRRWR